MRGQNLRIYQIRFQLDFHQWEIYCKAPNQREGAPWEEGFVGLMLHDVYYPATPVAPLFPYSSSAIYIHLMSTKKKYPDLENKSLT